MYEAPAPGPRGPHGAGRRDLGSAPPEGGGAGAAGDPPAAVACDICAGPMFDFHCRLICSNCGFQRDCSDP